jgi:hypothetical protein
MASGVHLEAFAPESPVMRGMVGGVVGIRPCYKNLGQHLLFKDTYPIVGTVDFLILY